MSKALPNAYICTDGQDPHWDKTSPINTPRLMDDEELQAKIAEIVEYWDFSPHQDEDSRIERLHREILGLINSQKIAWADYVIGEDYTNSSVSCQQHT